MERPISYGSAIVMLEEWRKAADMRDEVVRAAAAAGVTITDICKVSGIARSTVGRILSGRPDA